MDPGTFRDDEYVPKHQDPDRLSVSSATTKTSRSSKFSMSSVSSKMSRASAAAASVLKKGLSIARMSSRDSICSALFDLQPGDMCETVAPVTVRQEESLESEVVMELQVGTTLDVIEVGEGRRIKVSVGKHRAGKTEGWISSRTKINEPLVMKCNEDVKLATMDFEVGGMHEVKAMVTVRAAEDLDSDVITELKPGTTVRILELGVHNKRRAKVGSEWHTGWISTTTKAGELLIGKVEERGATARSMPFTTRSGTQVKQLLEAARAGNLEAIQKLCEPKDSVVGRFVSRPNLNSNDVRGKTALIYAAAFGHKLVVEYLLSKREVDVNALDDTQKCALHHAAKRTRKSTDLPGSEFVQGEIVTMLLQAGAYMEARDHNGCTALMFAVANGDLICTRNLLTHQANVNVKDFEGHRPLDYAINFGHDEIVKLLRAEGAMGCNGEEAEEEEGEAAAEPSVDGRDSRVDASPTTEADMENIDVEADAVASGDASIAVGKSKSGKKKPPAEASADAGAASAKPKSNKKKSVSSKASDACPEKAAKSDKADKHEKGDKSNKGDKSKTDKKSKKKDAGKEKKPPASIAMMEALARDDGTAEVAVEEMPKEDVDLKVRALGKLKIVCENPSTPGEVEAAIKVAQAEGASDEEVADAQQVLQTLKKKFYAMEALREAASGKDAKALREAIKQGEELGVTGADMDQAKAVLAKEGPRQKAREELESAHHDGNMDRLKAALEAAKKAGLASEELAKYEQIVSESESKEKIEGALAKAIASRDIGDLKMSIQQAKDMGLSTPKLKEAEAVLAEEEPKQEARENLAKALETCTKDALRAAIQGAKDAKLTPSEYAEAEQALAKEELKEKLLAGVKQALEDSKSVDTTSIDALRDSKDKLTRAIQEAVANGVPEISIAEAEIRRKKLHNSIEDLKGSIRVFCRIRPISKKETDAGDNEITKQLDSMTLQVAEHHEFKFDAVFTPGTQDEIFEDCKDLVQSALDGYNVTLFAYGQTGAGKTFTMAGVPGQLGVSPRTIKEIYALCEKQKDRFEYTIMGSMLELYRMDLVDLLVKGNPTATKSKLNIRQDKTGHVSIEHLTEEECRTAKELEKLVERGTQARAVAATQMNSESSRSHLVMMIRIISVNKETKEQLRGKILIVDLAGSERLKKSQTEADMQKESIEINKSLTALGDVIEALTKNQKVIPYRNHKLTQLMQDALGGSAKTLMFVNCSPANSNCDETLNSLKYAQRAKNITNTVKKS
eukprot:CAMPEP_0170217242 /NCGR_PEP_ID=MMETSP0116_2-20130129/8283_1 /TAXON_ID=400756 /ORGANISM="Durinskia baltica, Strain CSIRO CS-38" /LENGTH=1246 /DNA_ID=CAMNT_0010467869 /DNA_START=69 /DNA_END=3809 /DNA_ORIENTATION=+